MKSKLIVISLILFSILLCSCSKILSVSELDLLSKDNLIEVAAKRLGNSVTELNLSEEKIDTLFNDLNALKIDKKEQKHNTSKSDGLYYFTLTYTDSTKNTLVAIYEDKISIGSSIYKLDSNDLIKFNDYFN